MLYTTDAIVLRHANYGDYDRMVTLMSPTLGRIDAIARGSATRSRRPPSARAITTCAATTTALSARCTA